MIGAIRAVIDTRALRHNLAVVREAAPRSRIMAVIKANAYGHGMIPVARALAGADAFAVARVEEGVTLREAGLANPIVLLEGVQDAGALAVAAASDFELVVHDPEQLDMLSAFDGKQTLRVWLKVDTGMNRLGFAPQRFAATWRTLSDSQTVQQPLGLMTHLANADDRSNPTTAEQIRIFNELTAGCPGEYSIANSGGILGWPDSHRDCVRPGIMLYGVSPFREGTGREFGLEPVMSLVTRLIAIKTVPAGAAVGYGGCWTASRETRIGVAAVGYGDGYPWHLPSGTPVFVGDKRVALAGRNSMDMITVDLTGAAEAQIGDPVELWGNSLPVETVARCAGTIPYELLCGVTQRVTTVVSDE